MKGEERMQLVSPLRRKPATKDDKKALLKLAGSVKTPGVKVDTEAILRELRGK
jgi:hypothetical protein